MNWGAGKGGEDDFSRKKLDMNSTHFEDEHVSQNPPSEEAPCAHNSNTAEWMTSAHILCPLQKNVLSVHQLPIC